MALEDEYDLDVAIEPMPPPRFGTYAGAVDWGSVNQALSMQQRQQAAAQQAALRAQALRIKAQEDAIRFQGQQEYEQLLQGGAKPEEALRRTAHKLYYKNPAGMGAALRATQPKPPLPEPRIIDVNGTQVMDLGNRRQILPPARPATPSSINAVPILDAEGNVIGQGVPGASGQVVPLPRPPKDDNREQLLPGLRLQYQDVSSRLRDRSTPESEKAMLRAQKKRIQETMAEHGATLAPEPEMVEQIIPAVKGTGLLGTGLFAREITPAQTNYIPTYAEELPRPPTLSKPAAPKEGALIRDKKSGKLYRVVKGEPVLIKE